MDVARRLTAQAGLAVPALAIVLLAFQSGGYFPTAVGYGVVALAAVLGLVAVLAPATVSRPTGSMVALLALLALYVVWVLASAGWSDAAGRTLLDVDRALLYLLIAVAVGVTVRSVARLRTMLELSTVALVGVTVVSALARLRPDLWPTDPTIAPNRLSYPIGYWNGLGMLAALGILGCFHLSADLTTQAWKRCVAAAFLPVPAVVLVFTFSRGAILVLALGVAVYLLAALAWGALPALVAAAPTAFVVWAAYDARTLASLTPGTPAGLEEGRQVFTTLLLVCCAAAVLRAALIPLDRTFRRLPSHPRLVRGGVAVVALAAVIGGVAVLPSQVERVRVNLNTTGTSGGFTDARSRLTSIGSAARLDLWRVAMEDFRADRLKGNGAGSFETSYNRRRHAASDANEGHSLYVETLGELGAIGMVLLGAALLVGLAATIRPSGGPDRSVFALALAGSAAWMLGAGFDWHWELPAVTVWPLAAMAGAAGISRRSVRTWCWAPRWWIRVLPIVLLALLTIFPLAVARSQTEIERGVEALNAGRPGAALAAANAAHAAVGARAEPFELAAYSLMELGRGTEAIRAAESAVRRDRRDWEYTYALAVVRAAAGRDATAAASAAVRRNPLRKEPAELLAMLERRGAQDAGGRRRAAGTAPLLVGSTAAPLPGGFGPRYRPLVDGVSGEIPRP